MTTTLIDPTTPSPTRRDGNYTIYLEPRISANELARFMVSTHAQQESIVRNAKRMSKPKVATYGPARTAIAKCFDGTGISPSLLAAERQRLVTLSEDDAFNSQCNERSSAALAELLPLLDDILCFGNRKPRPRRGFSHLGLEGVRVSVQPDVVFEFDHQGITKLGGLLVNFSRGAKSSLMIKAGSRDLCAGHYVALLVKEMLATHFPGATVSARNCISVDVYRGLICSAPTAYKTMMKDVRAACRRIVQMWPDILLGDEGEESDL